jgi:hypothetical protein
MKKNGDARETEEILEGLTGYSPQSTGASGFSWRMKKKLDLGRKRWTTKWVAGELAIVRRLLLRTRDAG